MESIKPIIKNPSTVAQSSESGATTKKRKSVTFAPSPEKPSKRRALVNPLPAPGSKLLIKKSNKFIPSSRQPFNTLQWPRNHQSIIKQSIKVKSDEAFELPSQPIEPIDQSKDWFTSMYARTSCTANPVHVIGVKQNKSKRQCEGIEDLDEWLLRGEVNITFHPDHQHEPVCETCLTMGPKQKPEVEAKEKLSTNEPELPGSWPKEITEPVPHTHIYDIEYAACKCEGETAPENPERHSLRLVKGSSEYGGNGTLCHCTHTADKGSEDEEAQSTPIVKTKLLMPLFAGCPACDGKDLHTLVSTNQKVNKKR
ncbi:hypothetical protein TWF281_007798 [Arthrobotrys megalospora]